MLRNSFFTTVSIPEVSDKINTEKSIIFNVEININPDHKIFKGHFPEQPIVPGVVYIEMIREIMEIVFEQEFLIKEASNIKFLSITNPLINTNLHFEFNIIKKDEELISVKVIISSENGAVIKFDGKFLNK